MRTGQPRIVTNAQWTNLEVSRGTNDVHKHRTERCEKRLGTFQQLMLPHGLDLLTDLVLSIPGNLVELF